MSAAIQSMIVFGHVYFMHPFSNTTSIEHATGNTTLLPNLVPGSGVTEIRRSDYTYIPDIGAHKIHTDAVSWNEARKVCINEGGYLAIINSAPEAAHLKQLISKSGPFTLSQNPGYVFIGIHDLYHNDEFVTINGESLAAAGYSEWDSGEPNSSNENCGTLNVNTGKLNDIPCERSHAFICERPYVEL